MLSYEAKEAEVERIFLLLRRKMSNWKEQNVIANEWIFLPKEGTKNKDKLPVGFSPILGCSATEFMHVRADVQWEMQLWILNIGH